MTKNSAKTNLLFETFYQDNFNIDLIYPTEEDFNFLKEARADFDKNSFSAEAHHRPEVLAITMTDRNKIIRRLVAAILVGWTEMVDAMKAAFEKLGGTNTELKEIIANIKANQNKITGIESEEEPEEQSQATQVQNNSSQTANAGVINMGVNKNFCRLVIYDTSYNPPARRHLYVSKKVGNIYNITVGGSQLAPSHTWYDEPLFDSLQQAVNFIHNVNQTNIKTVVDTHNFRYSITDRSIDLGYRDQAGNKVQIADLSDAVLVNTACGPAYIQRKNKKCVESLQEKIVHLSNGDWQVQSEKGRNMGTYDTKKEAQKRLGQVEYFKHMNEEVNKDLEDKIRSVIAHKETDDWHDGKAYLFEVSDESKNSDNGDIDPFWIKKFDDDEVDFSKLKVYDRTPEEKEDGKYIATFMISGGKNGSGKWTDYLSQLTDAFKALEEKTGAEPLLYKIDTDICDDVWTGYVFLYDHDDNVKESLTEALAPSVKKLLTEGCWGMPYTLNDVNKLKDLMSHPVDAFEVGDQVENKNKDLGIGDDELFDRIADYRHKHKYGSKEANDVRKVIQDFIKDEVLPNWDSYSYSSPEGDYEGHTWENGVKEVFQEIADMDLKKATKEWEKKMEEKSAKLAEIQETSDSVEEIQQKAAELNKEPVEEDVEKHKHLNPKLFDNNHLKPQVREKCLEIVDLFLKLLEEDEVKIDIKDIIFTGSNASYNYTKDSDIDLHIIADTSNFECPDNLYPKLYNAYKSLFNSKYDISFYGIPVEIYVETGDTPLISNGIYSIKNDAWEQEPTETTIPEIDWNEFMKVYQPWEEEYRELVRNIDSETATDDKPIDDFITKVYELRHQGLANEGQYGFSNLIFKELRNRGHLQELKDLKNEIIENRLTLEALTEAANIDEKTRLIYRNKLAQIAHNQPIIQTNGLFKIFNVKADDADYIIRELYRQDLVEFASKTADKFDFSKINFDGMPSRYYTISGRIKL